MRPILQEKIQATETACESNQMLDLTGKAFKIATMNMSTELKESMMKEVQEDMMTVASNRVSIKR